jgi:hypothetical protein
MCAVSNDIYRPTCLPETTEDSDEENSDESEEEETTEDSSEDSKEGKLYCCALYEQLDDIEDIHVYFRGFESQLTFFSLTFTIRQNPKILAKIPTLILVLTPKKKVKKQLQTTLHSSQLKVCSVLQMTNLPVLKTTNLLPRRVRWMKC